MKRYDPTQCDQACPADMRECVGGDYILYDDAQERIAALEGVLRDALGVVETAASEAYSFGQREALLTLEGILSAAKALGVTPEE